MGPLCVATDVFLIVFTRKGRFTEFWRLLDGHLLAPSFAVAAANSEPNASNITLAASAVTTLVTSEGVVAPHQRRPHALRDHPHHAIDCGHIGTIDSTSWIGSGPPTDAKSSYLPRRLRSDTHRGGPDQAAERPVRSVHTIESTLLPRHPC